MSIYTGPVAIVSRSDSAAPVTLAISLDDNQQVIVDALPAANP